MSPPESTPNTMESTATLTCAKCGGENALASRFCQHCGAPLAAGATAPASNAGAATPGGDLPPIGVMLPPVASAAPNIATPASAPAPPAAVPSAMPAAPEQTAKEIDDRRAHQLLDRALMLSERGDLPGAILACRQAVSLAPASAQGYSMWGLLLERAGETGKAIAAYEKVLEIAPDSMLERESLQRLRAAAAKNSLTGTFHFDDGELFDDALGSGQPATPSGAVVAAAATANDPLAPVADMPPTGSTAAGSPPGVPVPPVTTAPTVAAPTPLRFDDPMDTPTGGPLWLQALVRQPSYYFRGAPIMATTVIGLIFLLWARNWAATRYVPTAPEPAPGLTEIVPGDPNTPPTGVNQDGTPMRVIPNNSATITNDPNAPAAPNTSTTTNSSTGSTTASGSTTGSATTGGGARGTTRSSTRSTTGSGSTSQPHVSTPVLPPANPRTVGQRPATGSRPGASGSVPSLPAPRVDLNSRPPAPAAPPVVIVPGNSDGGSTAGGSTGGGTSSGGGPFTPPSGTGYIRPAPPERVVPRSVSPASAPARSDNMADNAERIASEDARAGRSGRAVERLTSAMSTGGSTGYRYQQRATLFLERGDYARAADEYQTAISAYEDQLQRGDNAAQARAGLRSSRSGLRVALAGLRR